MFRFRFARPLVAALALITLGGCKPLDDVAVLVFGRSMRNQRSFDPYENPRGAPENSVAFASGNYPAAPGEVNLGQPEGVDVPRFTQLDLGTPGVGNEVIQGLVNPMDPNDAVSMARGEEIYMRFCVVCHGPDGVGANAYPFTKTGRRWLEQHDLRQKDRANDYTLRRHCNFARRDAQRFLSHPYPCAIICWWVRNLWRSIASTSMFSLHLRERHPSAVFASWPREPCR